MPQTRVGAFQLHQPWIAGDAGAQDRLPVAGKIVEIERYRLFDARSGDGLFGKAESHGRASLGLFAGDERS